MTYTNPFPQGTLTHQLFALPIPSILEITTQGPKEAQLAAWNTDTHTYTRCAHMALAAAYKALTETV
jgi:hypothetical protein